MFGKGEKVGLQQPTEPSLWGLTCLLTDSLTNSFFHSFRRHSWDDTEHWALLWFFKCGLRR
jgi:hypothetical protein